MKPFTRCGKLNSVLAATLLLCLLLSACGPEPTATPLPPTEVAIVPTDTPVPSTDTLIPPTDTPVPPTATPVDTPTPSPSPTLEPTASPVPSPTPEMTADGYLEQGFAFYEEGNLEEALDSFDQAIVLDPWPLETYHYRHAARLELEARRPVVELDEEIAGYDQVIAENAEDAEAYFRRGRAKVQRTVLSGEPADEEPLFDESSNVTVVGGQPTSTRLNLEHAIADLDQAIELDPGLAEAYHMRGLAYHLQGLEYIDIAQVDFDVKDIAQAIRDYDQAIALDPELTVAYHDRGTAYALRGWQVGRHADEVPDEVFQDLEQALRDFTVAIEQDPEAERTWLNRAFANLVLSLNLQSVGEDPRDSLQQCLDDSTQVIGSNPDSMWAYFLRIVAAQNLLETTEDEALAAQLESQANEDNETFGELGSRLLQQYDLSDLVTRILCLSSGPASDPYEAAESLLGTLEGDVYTSPDGGFRLQIPMLMQPNAVIWDEMTGSGHLLVWFEDDLARWYAVQVHPSTLRELSLEEWVGENVAENLDVQEERQTDTALGTAIVLTYRYAEPEADCCTAVAHQGERSYAVSYCLMGHYSGEGEEASIRTFGDFYGIEYEPVDAIAQGLLEDVEILR